MKRLSFILLAFLLASLMITGVGTQAQECGQPGVNCGAATWAWIAEQTLTALPTFTPTPTPNPTGTVAGQNYPIFAFVPIDSPTPIPTVTPLLLDNDVDVPTEPVYNALATVERNLAEAPERIDQGLAVLPHLPGGEAFGYAKWILGSSTSSEVFGPFAVIVQHVSAELLIIVALVSIYLIIFLARFVLRFVQWLISSILKIIPFFG